MKTKCDILDEKFGIQILLDCSDNLVQERESKESLSSYNCNEHLLEGCGIFVCVKSEKTKK